MSLRRVTVQPPVRPLSASGVGVVGSSSVEGVTDVQHGGTGLDEITEGALLVGRGVNELVVDEIAAVATGNVLLSAGVGTAPAWGKIANAHLAGGTYSAITGVGALAAGSIAAGFGGAVFGGGVTFSPDNTYDIGARAANRPRDAHVARYLWVGPVNSNYTPEANDTIIADTRVRIMRDIAGGAAGPNVALMGYRTSGGSLAALNNDDTIGGVTFRGYDGSAFQISAFIRGVTTAAFSGTDHGTKVSFWTTPAGSTVSAVVRTLDVSCDYGIDVLVGAVRVAGTKVVGAQGAAVADATDAATAISQLNALLARCRAHGLIAT